ncbi:MAG: hypothetical protein ONB24_15445 [candidate division KSB1 bacterium]|nr:hypothetical protein [candidate division KSB1 bacterium]
MIFADHCLEFPVAGTRPFVNNGRTVVNGYAVRNLSAAVLGFYALAPFFPAEPEMPVQFAALSLIIENEAVNGLVTDGRSAFNPKTTADLFWAPVVFQSLDHLGFDLGGETNLFAGVAAS